MQSMTGFGRSETLIGHHSFTIEIKSVNHRFFDTRYRLPHTLAMFEFQFTELLKGHFERGSFDIHVKQRVQASGEHGSFGNRFVVDEMAVQSLMEGCEWLAKKYQTPKVPSLEMLAMTNRVFVPIEESTDPTGLWEDIKKCFESAIFELKKMRQTEGKRLTQILKNGLLEIEKSVESLSQLAPEHPRKVKEKLEQRLAVWNLSTPVDATRLEWEVALLAERADITEEIDRLKIHTREFSKILESDKPIGRKLDFLTQELHRETNTIGSKAGSIEFSRLSVGVKSWIEKLREQVQNVE